MPFIDFQECWIRVGYWSGVVK